MSLKSRIEAVLFLTDKPLRAQAVARIVNEDVQIVRQAILELIHEYESRQGGLEIADDDGYIIQVKDEYASIIDEFVPMELPVSLVRTLSAIAIKQPVPQSEIIKIRGAGAYDHIKELLERELVAKKEEGRSPLLSTTKKFQEYFRLSNDAKSLRHELKAQLGLGASEESESTFVGEQAADPTLGGSDLGLTPDLLQSELVSESTAPASEPTSESDSTMSEGMLASNSDAGKSTAEPHQVGPVDVVVDEPVDEPPASAPGNDQFDPPPAAAEAVFNSEIISA